MNYDIDGTVLYYHMTTTTSTVRYGSTVPLPPRRNATITNETIREEERRRDEVSALLWVWQWHLRPDTHSSIIIIHQAARD